MNSKYIQFIGELKDSIRHSRYNAAKTVNKEQLLLYFKTGQQLSEKIAAEKWGAKVLQQIAADLQQQLPGLKGFSHRNLKNMRQFYEAYRAIPIGQTASAQLPKRLNNQAAAGQVSKGIKGQTVSAQSATPIDESFYNISFSHHISILNKCEKPDERLFYIAQAASQSWSLSTLEHHLEADLFRHQGTLANNFSESLPQHMKVSALEVFRDEYFFDFIEMGEDDSERVFEGQVVSNIKNTIMTLGKGFSFIGNQYRLELDGQEFFVDLLFYNRHLQCLVAFELKSGKFKPEYAGQLNFYLNVLDEKVKLPHEQPSIGIILCKEKNNTVVEFSFKNIDKGMGAATFRTSKQLPKNMKGILPEARDLAQIL